MMTNATALEQLAANLQSLDLNLSTLVLNGIEEIHQDNPNPCP